MAFWALGSVVAEADVDGGCDDLERRLIGFFLLMLPSMARYSAFFGMLLLLVLGGYRWL